MKNKAKIFEFLYKNSSESYNINQISRLIGISVGSSFKLLKEFERLGYVNANKKNNALLYRINLADRTKKFYEQLEEEENRRSRKKTKIICTISPHSNSAILKKLMEKGMDVARIDISDCDEKTAIKMLEAIRQASADIPVLIDISDLKSNKRWIKFALKNDLDFVAVLAERAEDVTETNKILGYNDLKQIIGDKIKVIARIGGKSLRNYREIIEKAYGAVIDRTNLLPNDKIEMLPKLQKEIIDECNKFGKPVIIAGNVLNSMVKDDCPMQSEIHDISNAVFEGASCIMLSEETKSGKYPIESVNMLSKIIKNAETGKIEAHGPENASYDLTRFIGNAVSVLKKLFHTDALLIITSGGYSARMVSSRRLKCKTMAATSRRKIFRQLHLLWGIEPLHAGINSEDIANNDKKEVILQALKKGFIRKRDQIAIIASIFHSKYKRTNLLEIHNVNEFLDYLNKNKKLGIKV